MMNQLLPPVKGYTAPTDTILSDTHDQYLFSVLPLSVMSFYTSLQMYDDIPLITMYERLGESKLCTFDYRTTVSYLWEQIFVFLFLNRRLYLKKFAIFIFSVS